MAPKSSSGRHLALQDFRRVILIPTARAYVLGYLSSTGPRIANIVFSYIRKSRRHENPLLPIYNVLLGALALHRFPAFCGLLIGGSKLLQSLFNVVFSKSLLVLNVSNVKVGNKVVRRVSKFLATFVAAWLSIQLLNSKPRQTRQKKAATTGGESVLIEEFEPSGTVDKPVVLAGKTVDLTLFAGLRALDVIIGELWSRHRRRRLTKNQWTCFENAVSHGTDAVIFAVSSGLVMWAWFYHPDRLPRQYNRWIGEAAQVDSRLVDALRRAREGKFVYGEDTGQAYLLQSMCRDYTWPETWGNPMQTIPIPCEMVHMGCGPSCEKHALHRFLGAFKFAFLTYVPLNLAIKMRNPSQKALVKAMMDAGRSSSFLASFICLFYYGVCLSRTRLGPLLFDRKRVTPQMWDSGLCVGAGCILCGWSILLEAERRRQEIAFFVAPRAAATFFPRSYDKKYQWREALAFAASTAVVFTCVQENPQRVRGVLGRLLKQLVGES